MSDYTEDSPLLSEPVGDKENIRLRARRAFDEMEDDDLPETDGEFESEYVGNSETRKAKSGTGYTPPEDMSGADWDEEDDDEGSEDEMEFDSETQKKLAKETADFLVDLYVAGSPKLFHQFTKISETKIISLVEEHDLPPALLELVRTINDNNKSRFSVDPDYEKILRRAARSLCEVRGIKVGPEGQLITALGLITVQQVSAAAQIQRENKQQWERIYDIVEQGVKSNKEKEDKE